MGGKDNETAHCEYVWTLEDLILDDKIPKRQACEAFGKELCLGLAVNGNEKTWYSTNTA